MPTVNGDTVPFGQDHLVPPGTQTAWGARLIVTQNGFVDFVPDRQGAAGTDRDLLLADLATAVPVDVLLNRIKELLRSGQMDTRVGADFTIHDAAGIEVHANTNGSGGYCYVTAWRKP